MCENYNKCENEGKCARKFDTNVRYQNQYKSVPGCDCVRGYHGKKCEMGNSKYN